MTKHMKLLDLLDQKKIKEFELEQLIYGSIEVREKNDNKYIYIHAKENGIQVTKYIGEYSDTLYNLILNNNLRSRELKKEIKQMEKDLKELNYIEGEISKEVSINFDFAKKHLAETIYTQAILEGIATTLSDTENIIEGGKINNMSVDDVMKIINLKHAWEFILNKNVIISPTNYSVLNTINRLVEEGFYYSAGELRTTPVKIGGTTWEPELPIESEIKKDIDTITSKKKIHIDIAIELLLYVVRKQMFLDGNKRTSVIFANHYLISKGKGLIVIPVDLADYYKKLLIEYYETNNSKEITKFLKEQCYLNLKN